MMKKRVISLFVVLCLCVALLCPAVLAEGNPKYVALGDSIAAGYGLSGFAHITGKSGSLNFTVPEGCFAKLVAKQRGYDLQNLAVSGDDTSDLLARLKTAQYSNAVKDADIITLTIGSNDILVPVMDMISKKFLPESSDHSDLATVGTGKLLSGDFTTMTATLQSVNDYLNSSEVATALDKQVASFKTNWDTVIDTILKLNPDVELLVTDYYHPYSMLDMTYGNLKLNIGTLGYRYINQLNEYIKNNTRNGTSYTIVNVTSVKTNVKLDTSALIAAALGGKSDLSNAVNLDPHPSAAGHSYIATQINAALDAKQAVKIPKLAAGFPDVEAGAWYAEAVSFASEKSLMVGGADGSFNPTGSTTIAQFMTILYRYAYAQAPSVIPEKSTTGADWQEAALYLNTTLMNGRFDDLTRDMTRYEMAEITAGVMRYLSEVTGKSPNTRETHGFTDVTDNVDVAYLESIYGVNGILQSDGTYVFNGDNLITRAEVAQTVYNIIDKSM